MDPLEAIELELDEGGGRRSGALAVRLAPAAAHPRGERSSYRRWKLPPPVMANLHTARRGSCCPTWWTPLLLPLRPQLLHHRRVNMAIPGGQSSSHCTATPTRDEDWNGAQRHQQAHHPHAHPHRVQGGFPYLYNKSAARGTTQRLPPPHGHVHQGEDPDLPAFYYDPSSTPSPATSRGAGVAPEDDYGEEDEAWVLPEGGAAAAGGHPASPATPPPPASPSVGAPRPF